LVWFGFWGGQRCWVASLRDMAPLQPFCCRRFACPPVGISGIPRSFDFGIDKSASLLERSAECFSGMMAQTGLSLRFVAVAVLRNNDGYFGPWSVFLPKVVCLPFLTSSAF